MLHMDLSLLLNYDCKFKHQCKKHAEYACCLDECTITGLLCIYDFDNNMCSFFQNSQTNTPIAVIFTAIVMLLFFVCYHKNFRIPGIHDGTIMTCDMQQRKIKNSTFCYNDIHVHMYSYNYSIILPYTVVLPSSPRILSTYSP